jgi:hypothetical protein
LSRHYLCLNWKLSRLKLSQVMDIGETWSQNILTETKIQTWLSIFLKYQDSKLIASDNCLRTIYSKIVCYEDWSLVKSWSRCHTCRTPHAYKEIMNVSFKLAGVSLLKFLSSFVIFQWISIGYFAWMALNMGDTYSCTNFIAFYAFYG